MEHAELPRFAPNALIEFDWAGKWLTGEEYSHVLHNIDLYCSSFGLGRYGTRQHPNTIYEAPYNGLVYFVEGSSVGSEFGFPRVEIKKKFRWKKMNFTTELPKRKPLVSYIVASAVKCERFFPNAHKEGPAFRMHAVILVKPSAKSYVLCHVRKLASSEETPPVSLAPTVEREERWPLPAKKQKKSAEDGLQALLEAAVGSDTSEEDREKEEIDYVALYHSTSPDKFPAFAGPNYH